MSKTQTTIQRFEPTESDRTAADREEFSRSEPSMRPAADMTTLQITDDLDLLLAVLPVRIREALQQDARLSDLIEVVMDLGRLPEARFSNGEIYLSDTEVTAEDLRRPSTGSATLAQTTGPGSNARYTAFPPSVTGGAI